METLWQKYQQLKSENTHLFQYDAAKRLNVSEGALLMTAPDAKYLGTNYDEILERLTEIQDVQITVRNDLAVHEKNTRILPLKKSSHVVMAIQVGGYDVRLFPKHWHHVIAFDFPSRGTTIRSIQFYDAKGHALQKIYLRSEQDNAIWQSIIDDFKQESVPEFLLKTDSVAVQDLPLDDAHKQAFQQRWREMTNIHQFFGLLNDYKLTRYQAFENAPTGYAYQIETSKIEIAYMQAAEKEVPLINFVGNEGIIQIQTGTVKNVSRMQGWLNIFDAKHNGFTLHLDDTGIASTWLVLRPTKDGIVSCLECLDQQGKSIITIFGQRVEGQPELHAWRELLTAVTGHQISDDI